MQNKYQIIIKSERMVNQCKINSYLPVRLNHSNPGIIPNQSLSPLYSRKRRKNVQALSKY